MKLEISSENGIIVLRPNGKNLDASNVDAFRSSMTAAVMGIDTVILDLSTIEFMDSSGLGSIIFANSQLASDGGRMVVCEVQPGVKVLFEVVHADRVLSIAISITQAGALLTK